MRVFAFLLDEKVTNDGLGPLDPRQEAVRKRVLDSGLTASRFANPDELQHLLYRTLMERLTTPRGVVPSVERSPGEVTTIDLGSGVEMKFAWCPPGTFPMGSPAGEPQREDDETQHQVTLTRGYWLGIHLVTQAQWQAVMGSSPGQFRGDTFPVERVSWEDCQEFIKRLAQKTGRRFRLPTEAEWEYACRAGTDTPFHFGKTISTDQANYDGRHTHGKCEKGVFQERTTPVAHFPANAWGLYDMHGNLWEWCQDRYWPYPSAEIIDPQGDNDGTARVVRGGTWYDGPWLCRSAYRGRAEPGRRFDLFGCRVLLCQD